MSAFAVLVGGFISARTDRHDLVAVIGLRSTALALVPIAFFDLGAAMLIGLMGLSGFFSGVFQPSRDMIVRAVTPPGAFGRVFGFVTTGFSIGGVIAPPIFGYFMDHSSRALCCSSPALRLRRDSDRGGVTAARSRAATPADGCQDSPVRTARISIVLRFHRRQSSSDGAFAVMLILQVSPYACAVE